MCVFGGGAGDWGLENEDRQYCLWNPVRGLGTEGENIQIYICMYICVCVCVFVFPSQEDLPNLGIEPRSPALQADSLPSELPG